MDFNNPALILCEDDKSALDLYNILLAINPKNDVCYFPAHDSLPFSDERSSNEILLERSFQLINLKIPAIRFMDIVELIHSPDSIFKRV